MSNEHYDAGGIPVIDVIRAKLTQEQFEGYLLGNVIKYSLRLNFKDSKEKDAGKLSEYAMWLDESYRKESPTVQDRIEDFKRQYEKSVLASARGEQL